MSEVFSLITVQVGAKALTREGSLLAVLPRLPSGTQAGHGHGLAHPLRAARAPGERVSTARRRPGRHSPLAAARTRERAAPWRPPGSSARVLLSRGKLAPFREELREFTKGRALSSSPPPVFQRFTLRGARGV